ncbi:MAG TPA: hypothetical protein VN923_20230, partial [Thermoanaerobaculia bacterium]|nr:hypothetical protein [Thermoanaerobaculia bacterium]
MPAVVLAACCLLVVACGKKGNPLPPARVIPNPTQDLAVSQRGNQLVVRFGYPQTTTAGAKLPGLASVEVAAMTRQVPAGTAELPIVDAREFAAAAKTVATLRGEELQSAIEGGHVVVRLPLPEVPPPAVAPVATPVATPAATPAPSPAPSPAPTAAPTATSTAPARTLYVYGVRTVAEGGEASAWSNLTRVVLQAPPPAPSGLS